MPDDQLALIWKTTLKDLEGVFPAGVHKTMFRKVSLTGIQGDVATLTVDNHTTRNFLQKYAATVLIEKLNDGLENPISRLQYVVLPAPKTLAAKKAPESPLFEQGRRGFEPNPMLSANLNPKYTFASFIIGNRTRLAHAAAQAVAEKPGTLYNPLCLYGGVGLGKTHLMQAIGNDLLQRFPDKKVLYVSCESFMNEFVASIRGAGKDDFKRKYRNIDVFLVDDIQFMAGKDGMQEEFFHTFNALYQGNAQIVITSDRVPSQIKDLEERLTSRFSMGLVADMQLPDLETRQAILLSKCQERGITLPAEAITYIADLINTNIRELEGALTRVVLTIHSAAGQNQPTLEEIKRALTGIISPTRPNKKSSTQLLSEIVCTFYNISQLDLVGPRRQQELVKPRQVLMYLLKNELGLTFPTIGREIGGRDHTTAMHAVEKIEREMKKSAELLDELQAIKEQFYSSK